MRIARGWSDRTLWILLGCALATGCQGVSVWRVVSAPRVWPTVSRDRTDIAALPHADGDRGGPDGRRAAAADSYAAGRAAARVSPELAARYQLGAIADASAALAALPPAPGANGADDDRRIVDAREISNAALEELLRLTGGRWIHPDAKWRARLAANGVRVVGPGDGDPSCCDPDRFDELLFTRDYNVRGMEHPYRTEGIGVPLIAVRRFDPMRLGHREGEDRFLMPHEVYPVTAVLRIVTPAGEHGPTAATEYRLELRDPLTTHQVELAGRARPLASDLTTPLAYHFARSPLPILQEVGLLDPGWLEPLQGLYMLHPYEPGKIPVVFVHGLRSSPLAWLKVINEIWGDPALRDRYQVWLFIYPTGKPIPASAAALRAGLDDLRRGIDPKHADPALDRMMLVGHSMGGLISKMMVLESGEEIWRLFSHRPFEELQAPTESRERLRQALFFHPVPSVARIVFVATPHRGSELGDGPIGRITDRLIRLPRALRSTYRALMTQNGRDFFTPMLKDGVPTSIDELRFDNPFLTTLARLPRRADVPVHSIIGRKDPAVPLEESSDGVVPYVSSHIDWADSERVVTGDHGCQDIPETIAEIRRILRLHLGAEAPEASLRP